MNDLTVTILGIDYKVEVTHYTNYEPCKGLCLAQCTSPDEAYGDEEFEFDIYDEYGVKCNELKECITSKEYERILEVYKQRLTNDWEN